MSVKGGLEMNANKYGIISLVLGIVLFFGTYFMSYQNAGAVITGGWTGILLTLFYGGLLSLGLFFFLVGLLMLVL